MPRRGPRIITSAGTAIDAHTIDCSPLRVRATSVGATLRVVRASNCTPRRSSRPRTAWLSADRDTPSRFAAFVKLRSSATVRTEVRDVQVVELH